MYTYIKALHIIFIVTWFSGLFYVVRLFIYNTESGERNEVERQILRTQFGIMIRRLWLGITWPSAVLTLVFGSWILYLHGAVPLWMWAKIFFVAALYFYHFSLQHIFNQQMKGVFRYSSQQLRIWNEVATLFLVSIVMIVVVKEQIRVVWGIAGLILLIIVLMAAIRLYKVLRLPKN